MPVLAMPRHFRTLFLSDFHLGFKGCQAARLLDFLRRHDAETIYLVGDIIDGWRLRRSWYWPQEHNDVVQKVLRKARKGSRVVYVPGNHDEFLRDYVGTHFGGVEVLERAIHVAADGRRLLILHGDEFDVVVRHARWVALLGDRAYSAAMALNGLLNRGRRILGLGHWSLSAWLNQRAVNVVNAHAAFDRALEFEARTAGVDGVVCGHMHVPELRSERGLVYINTGDWVENCTAVAEHHDGRLEIIRWAAADAAILEPDEDLTEEAIVSEAAE
jgi:UDP-2,3-diacylglucosamine pyrophosphatase LpxH